MNYQKFLQEVKKRDKEIFKKRKKGLTFKALGKEYGISPQRAKQICKKLESADNEKS